MTKPKKWCRECHLATEASAHSDGLCEWCWDAEHPEFVVSDGRQGLCIVCEENPIDYKENEISYYCLQCLAEIEYMEYDSGEIEPDDPTVMERSDKVCTACWSSPPMPRRNICLECYQYDAWVADEYGQWDGGGKWDKGIRLVIPDVSEEMETFAAVRS